MVLVDSHCHLDMLGDDKAIDEIILRANQAGVNYMQTICTRLDNLPNILNIANKSKHIYASVGVHPCEVNSEIISAEELIKISNNAKIIGLGETGLDYYHDTSLMREQKTSFISHIQAGQVNNLPLIIHTRSADQDTIEIITTEMKKSHFRGLIHCFTASQELAYKMLDLGLYISISGIVTFKNANELQEIVRSLPLDRLLIETDSPYLAPVPMRKNSNEPAYVSFVADFIAKLKNIPVEIVAEKTTQNFFTLFDKAIKS